MRMQGNEKVSVKYSWVMKEGNEDGKTEQMNFLKSVDEGSMM